MTYNPLIAAISAGFTAAWIELTSQKARIYYTYGWQMHNRAMVTTAIATIEATVITAEVVYKLTTFLWGIKTWIESQDYEIEIPPPARVFYLPAAPAAIALLPAISSAPRPILVTPAPVQSPIAAVANTPLDSLGIRELRQLCTERGISKAYRLSKAQAIAALTAA